MYIYMKIKNKSIQLRNVNKIFPNEFTKVRMEDFQRIAIENKTKLTKSEFNELSDMKRIMSDNRYNGSFEFFAKKKKGRIELIPFD